MAQRTQRNPGRAAQAREIRSVSAEETGHTRQYDRILRRPLESNQLNDPFDTWGVYGQQPSTVSPYPALEPIYPFDALNRIFLESNILRQCVEAMVVNADSYGHALEYVGPEGGEDSDPVQAEKKLLESFLEAPSPENTLIEIRKMARTDREVMGNCCFEVSRDRRGRVVMMDHIPASTLRQTRRDPVPVDTYMQVPSRDEEGVWTRQKIRRFFRRFVQVTLTGERIYFKEFGDPRPINPKDGQVNPALPVEDQATEVLYISNYTPGSVYGTPRWIGNLPSILGSRESEMVNLNFFRDNAIPAMAVLVSGGALTEDSFKKVESYINAVRGAKAMNRVLVLEAAADDAAGAIDHSQPAPKIDMKPMISERQQEGLFQGYDQQNTGKVRSSFRLPPIYTGRAEDYTRASAFASMITAENQVFQPERNDFDEVMNRRILATYRPVFWRFKSLGPSVVEPDILAKLVTALGGQGALTPNAVIKIANRVLDLDIQKITDAWGDYPMTVIQSYVDQGGVLKGMNDFILRLGAAAPANSQGNTVPGALPPPPGSLPDDGKDHPAETQDPTDSQGNLVEMRTTEAMVRRIVRRQLAAVVADLREMAALQTSASEVS